MKKIISLLLFFGFQISLLYAQNQMPPVPNGPQANRRIAHLQERLNLTGEQTARIEARLSIEKNRIEAFMKKQDEEREQFQKSMKAASDSSDNELMSILNDEQKKEFKLLLEEKKNMSPMGMVPPPAGQFGAPGMGPQPGAQPFPGRRMMPPNDQFQCPGMPPPPGERVDNRRAAQPEKQFNRDTKGKQQVHRRNFDDKKPAQKRGSDDRQMMPPPLVD